jgi:hypothetical protein
LGGVAQSRENREVRARERDALDAERLQVRFELFRIVSNRLESSRVATHAPDAGRLQRLAFERRTMVAELEAERARFELEKRAFQENVGASQASMDGGGGGGGGWGMDPTGAAALEQVGFCRDRVSATSD